MIDLKERRRFSRVTFNTPVTLQQGDTPWQAELVDISLKGFLVEGPAPGDWNAALPVVAHIKLSEQMTISMNAHIVHREAYQTGLSCDTIDLESITHLRRLIELNLGDPAAAERELTELITSH